MKQLPKTIANFLRTTPLHLSSTHRPFSSKTMVNSYFASVPSIPKDPIFALTAQYEKDDSPQKVNLGQGVYRDDTGKPWILPSVQNARVELSKRQLNHEYLPILGLKEFRDAACRLVLGRETYGSMSSRIASCQSLSGTGGLHNIGALIKQSCFPKPVVLIPEPTWSNHYLVFESLGFKCQPFRYYDFTTKRIDMEAYRLALQSADPGSIVILHACAHNPTGCDLSQKQWREIGSLVKEKQLFPLFDAAYLGFNSGSVDNDAFAIRYFVKELKLEMAVSVSFAKSMGLYGERVGCTFFITKRENIAKNVESMLERLQRAEVSNPPAYGAKIASTILNDDKLKNQWFTDLTTMCSRIQNVRQQLQNLLITNGAPGDWDTITQQTGMFAILGLPLNIVTDLRENYHIYMADSSRISLSGLNSSNVAYVAQSIAKCLSEKTQGLSKSQISAML